MADYTINYKLIKPGDNDNYSVADANGNMDIIDGELVLRATRCASADNVLVTGVSPQMIASFTPKADGNYKIMLYLRVLTETKVTASVTFGDEAGNQTKYLWYQSGNLFFPPENGARVYEPGSFELPALFIHSIAAAPISVAITAGTANAVYASACILGV